MDELHSCLSTFVKTAIFEVRRSVAVSGAVGPVPSVVDPMIFVIVKVVNGALTVRNCRTREESTPTHASLVKAAVELIFVVKYLE